jgi:hypothetical protein
VTAVRPRKRKYDRNKHESGVSGRVAYLERAREIAKYGRAGVWKMILKSKIERIEQENRRDGRSQAGTLVGRRESGDPWLPTQWRNQSESNASSDLGNIYE